MEIYVDKQKTMCYNLHMIHPKRGVVYHIGGGFDMKRHPHMRKLVQIRSPDSDGHQMAIIDKDAKTS